MGGGAGAETIGKSAVEFEGGSDPTIPSKKKGVINIGRATKANINTRGKMKIHPGRYMYIVRNFLTVDDADSQKFSDCCVQTVRKNRVASRLFLTVDEIDAG